MFKITVLVLATAVTSIFLYSWVADTAIPQLPDLNYNKWWGDGPKTNTDDAIRPFKIVVNDKIIEDLKARIKNRRPSTPSLDNAYSNYGMNSEYLDKTMQYWANEYDFKERIDKLNRLPRYVTKIQGLDIQFIRVKPIVQRKDTKILPLLLLHGWPSSSKEFIKVIPGLTTERDDTHFVFEVISPDLPGFGFSQGTNKKGLNPVQMAIIMRNLMQRLGFKQFYIHGGDWGSQCGTHMATLFPDQILGFHNSMAISSMKRGQIKFIFWYMFPSLFGDEEYVHKVYPLSDYIKYFVREFGYFHLQATKPDTLGFALNDSPSGMAAYIMEKMAMCTNRDQLDTIHGGLHDLDKDDVLDTITIAWIGNTITRSMRIYSEAMDSSNNEVRTLHEIPTNVPTAALNFKYEVCFQPDCVIKTKFPNLVHSTILDYGGHFGAMQHPTEFTNDLIESTREFLKFHENTK